MKGLENLNNKTFSQIVKQAEGNEKFA